MRSNLATAGCIYHVPLDKNIAAAMQTEADSQLTLYKFRPVTILFTQETKMFLYKFDIIDYTEHITKRKMRNAQRRDDSLWWSLEKK